MYPAAQHRLVADYKSPNQAVKKFPVPRQDPEAIISMLGSLEYMYQNAERVRLDPAAAEAAHLDSDRTQQRRGVHKEGRGAKSSRASRSQLCRDYCIAPESLTARWPEEEAQ